MPITINGAVHADGRPLTIGGVQAERVTVNGVTVWQDSITIPIPQQSAQLNLTTFINANNPNNVSNIILTNAFVQPTMNSGTLAGITLRFENNNQIQGLAAGSHALIVEAAMTLINNSTIASGGGNGGTGAVGAKGADDTYPVDRVDSQYAQLVYEWRVRCPDYQYADIWWNSAHGQSSNCTDTGPVFISGHEIRRGTKINDNWGGVYRVDRHYTTQEPRTGGAGGTGGVGGKGAHFSNVAAQPGGGGGAGSPSSPAGGNSGGTGNTGGAGGALGANGSVGTGGGTAGTASGTGIVGVGFLTAESDIGTVLGGTT